MITTLWLALAAHAEPALSEAELAVEDTDAAALIASCQAAGRACRATELELGRAFVVRAAAAAVLRGQVDLTSAANARFLAPEVVEPWQALLAATEGAPEQWVMTWRDGAPASEPPVEEARARPASADRGLEVLVGAAFHAVGNQQTWEGFGLGRMPLSRRVAGVLDASHRTTWIEGAIAYPGSAPTTIVGFEDRLRLGAGPRWATAGGAELYVFAAAVGSVTSLAPTTRDALDDEAATRTPTRYGGGALGAVAVLPFRPGGPLAARVETWLQAQHARMPGFEASVQDPADPSGGLMDVVVDPYGMTEVALTVEPGLRWAPGRSGLAVGMALPFDIERTYLLDAVARGGRIGAHVTAGWVTARINMLDLRSRSVESSLSPRPR